MPSTTATCLGAVLRSSFLNVQIADVGRFRNPRADAGAYFFCRLPGLLEISSPKRESSKSAEQQLLLKTAVSSRKMYWIHCVKRLGASLSSMAAA